MAKQWPRAIILVDMNAFFASIEQLDNPQWRQKPVVVTNGPAGTCIITCSYEARRFGVKTGMALVGGAAALPTVDSGTIAAAALCCGVEADYAGFAGRYTGH